MNINNKLLALGLFSLSSLTSLPGFSAFDDHSFYFDSGVSVHRFHIARKAKGFRMDSTRLTRNDNTGVSFIIGKRFGEFGAEAGYTAMNSQNYKRHAVITDVRLSDIGLSETFNHENANVYFDVNKYFKLVDNFELKAAAGVGILQTKTKHNIIDNLRKNIIPEIKNSEAEIKPRFGAGLQYNFTRTWSANMELNYQLGNQLYKTMRTTGVNVSYRL